jgi:uncharacterized membrane protein YgcG
MKNGRAFLILAFVISALLLLPASASAQAGRSVVVKQRDAEITILANGDAQFVETWVVDFQRGAFTFAFREIPKNNLREIADWGVREGDRIFQNGYGEYSFRPEETEDKYKITWNFAATNQGAKFFSDVHTFVLNYTVRGAMRIYPQGDQFWWKFVEGGRAYPLESARVTLHLPAAFAPDQIKATTYLDADETYGGRALDGETIQFNGGPFPPDAVWEIRAQFPHVINAAPEEWQKWDDRVEQIAAQNNFYATVAFVIILIGGPLLLLVLWYVFGRDKPTTFGAEFLPRPPDDTPPGVVGTLLDERADLQDILATVADLAQRGFLRIREADGFGSPVYERVARAETDLAPFEKATLDALLGSSDARTLDALRGNFYYRLEDLKSALYLEVVARGYFPASPLATRDLYFRIGKWGAILLPIIGFATACFTIVFAPLAFLPLCGLEIFFIVLLGLSRVMPQRTAQGATAAAQWNAFKRYLARLEKYDSVKNAQDKFAEYLPYAIAFGLEKSWIEKFKPTDAPAPTWYVPYTAPGKTNDDWTWRNVDTTPSRDSTARPSGAPNFPAPNAPLFRDSPSEQQGAPNLDDAARASFVGLNRVSGNMFDFLNSSASAFTEPPPRTSAVESFFGGVGDVLHWIGSSSGSSSSSDSFSSSSPSSSSSSSWSGGGSSGGSGGGGGSSGFG